MSSDLQNSSIPVAVPSAAYLAYLRHIENHQTMDAHIGLPMAFALEGAADADRGIASLGDVEPAAHRLVVHDLREFGRSRLNARITNGRWGVIGLNGEDLFDLDASPALTVGGVLCLSEQVAPIVLKHAERVWVYATLPEGNEPPALIEVPVLSQAGHVLLQLGLAGDALEARDRLSVSSSRDASAKRFEYLETAARHLAKAADITAGHPQRVVAELRTIVGAHFELSMQSTTGIGAPFRRLVDPRQGPDLQEAMTDFERNNGIAAGWVDSSLAMARLAFGRSRPDGAPTLERATPRSDA